MAERIAYLEAVVGADITSFRRGMQEVRRETGLLSDTLGGIGRLGRDMTLAVTAPMVALASGAVKMAGDFDAAMRNINSIAFLSEDQFKALSERTLEFGESIRSGPTAAAQGLYTVFSAGITDVDSAFNIMQVSAKTAEAGLADLTTTTEGLTAAALTFGDQSAAAMQKYSDATTLAVQLGVGSMDNFNTGFANVMGTSAAVGESFQDMAASVAFLSQRGIDAAAAGTYLNNALSKLIKPSSELSAVFTKLGVKSGKELITTFGGVEGALRAIYKLVGSDETVWAKLFPDVRGFKAVSRFFTSFEQDGTDAVSTFFDNFDQKMSEGGVTMGAWQQQMMSFQAQWDMLTSAVSGFAITIGQILIPVILPVVTGMRDLFLNLQQTDPAFLKLAVSVGALVAAAGPLLWIIGSLASPFTLLIGLAAGLFTAFVTNFNGIRDNVMKAVTDILGPLDDLKSGVETFINDLFGDDGSVQKAVGGGGGGGGNVISTPVTFELKPAYDPQFKSIAELAKENNVGIDDILKALGVGSLKEAMSVKPGVYTLDMKVAPNVSFDTSALSAQTSKLMELAALDNGPADNSVGGRIARAFADAGPKIEAALGQVFDNVKNWILTTGLPKLDELAGKGLYFVANIFGGTDSSDGSGSTPVFTAIHDLLDGGLAAAANDVGNLIDKYFPNSKSGFEKLINNIGDWLINEGIPTLARTVGYVGAKLGILIGEAINVAFQALSGGAAGDGADKLGKAVFQPLVEGADQAMKESGVTNLGDKIATAIAGALGVATIGAIILGGLGSGIGFAVSTITAGTSWIVSIATSIAGSLGSALAGSTIGQSVVKSVGNLFAGKVIEVAPGEFQFIASSGLLDSIKNGLGNLVSKAMALPGMGWAASAASSIASTIGTALSALAGIVLPLTAIVLSIVSIGAMIFSPEARKAVHDGFAQFFDSMFGEGMYSTFENSFEGASYEIASGIARAVGKTDVADELHRMAEEQRKKAQDAMSGGVDVKAPVHVEFFEDKSFGADAVPFFQQLVSQAVPQGTDMHWEGDKFIVTIPAGATIDASIYFKLKEAASKETDPQIKAALEAQAAGFYAAQKEVIDQYAQDHGIDMGEYMKTTVQNSSSKIDVNQDLIIPLMDYNTQTAGTDIPAVDAVKAVSSGVADQIIQSFGEDSPARVAWVSFVTMIGMDTALTGVAFGAMSISIMGSAFVIQNTIKNLYTQISVPIDAMIKLFDGLAGSIRGVGGAIVDMATNAPKMGPALNTIGGGGALGAHASGGTAEGWSMVGERGPEPVYFGSKGTVMPTRVLRDAVSGGNGGSSNHNEINIYGVQDVDGLLFELRRRGYAL